MLWALIGEVSDLYLSICYYECLLKGKGLVHYATLAWLAFLVFINGCVFFVVVVSQAILSDLTKLRDAIRGRKCEVHVDSVLGKG